MNYIDDHMFKNIINYEYVNLIEIVDESAIVPIFRLSKHIGEKFFNVKCEYCDFACFTNGKQIFIKDDFKKCKLSIKEKLIKDIIE